MKRKQLMALLMAGVVLAGSTMGSNASGVSSNTVSENLIGQEITGTGDVDYIDTTVYEVIIPTTGVLDLTVDPQGLTGLEDGKSATADQLSAYAGKVYSDDVAVIANLGSKDVKVRVDLKLTGDATGVTTKDDVKSGTANNILLYAVPAAKDFYDDAKDGASYAGSTTGIVMGSTPATIDFVVPHTDFEFKKDGSDVTYERVADSTPHGTGLKFAGLVNTDADWTDYKDGGDKSIGMTAKFTFTHTLTSGDVADTTEGAPAFMKTYTGTKVTVEAEAEANVETGHAEFGADGSKIWLGCTTNGGITDASKLQNVEISQNGGSAASVTATAQNGYGLVTWKDAKAAGATWVAGQTLTITFDYDGTSYQATVTIPNL